MSGDDDIVFRHAPLPSSTYTLNSIGSSVLYPGGRILFIAPTSRPDRTQDLYVTRTITHYVLLSSTEELHPPTTVVHTGTSSVLHFVSPTSSSTF